MEFAYLHYGIYKTCPLQYKWRFVERPTIYIRIDKRNAFIGFVLAKLVENFYREKWWSTPDPIERMRLSVTKVSTLIMEGEGIHLTDNELTNWIQVANDTIPMIIATIKAEKLLSEEVFVEKEEEVPLDNDKLQMRPDFFMKRKDEITLLDGKGGKTIGRYVDSDQLLFYGIGIEKIYNKLPDRAGFWWFRHGRITWIPVTQEAVEGVRAKARSFISGIKAKKFDPTPSESCRLCDYKSICPTGQEFLAPSTKPTEADIPSGNFGEIDFV